MWTPTQSRSRRFALLLATATLSGEITARADGGSEAPPAANSPLDSFREDFRRGMDHYAAGRYLEAIALWEHIYRRIQEVSPGQGYRLAFNLARAFDKVKDPSRAAEYFETYVREVEARRAAGTPLEQAVEKQADDATARLSALKAEYGRVVVRPGPRAVQFDADAPRVGSRELTWYVAVGTTHSVSFVPSAGDALTVFPLKGGEVITLDIPPLETPRRMEAPADLRVRTSVERPFSSTYLWVFAGAAALSLTVPAVLYASALSTKSDYDALPNDRRSEKEDVASRYERARTTAYGSLAIPAALTIVTGALTAWYYAGSVERSVVIRPDATLGAGHGSVGIRGSF